MCQDQRFCEIADADATYDLLEQVTGEFAAPSPGQVRELTPQFITLLERLTVNASFLIGRHGHPARQAVDRARRLVTVPAPTGEEEARGHLRRPAHATSTLLELESTAPSDHQPHR
ncbi:DUF6415 family natural product biosynthesis protein [Streptomyces roseifaciens]|uniref:DUF6415 family natural product biosynthesis protein n=1 Tax=Streptomyces roseifaciens TaxID=1488406 RepID=UPI000717EC80|nr:DUF6415 family natural product biosynthesis protein [Streptomyces roseifaciens]